LIILWTTRRKWIKSKRRRWSFHNHFGNQNEEREKALRMAPTRADQEKKKKNRCVVRLPPERRTGVHKPVLHKIIRRNEQAAVEVRSKG